MLAVLTVNGKVLIALVFAGLGVVAYAIVSMTGRPAHVPRTRETKAVAKGSKNSAKTSVTNAARPAGPNPFARAEPEPSGQPRINHPVAPPPGNERTRPVPEPMTFEDAEASFEDLMLELDREIRRGEEVGRPISTQAWVEYYRRGNEALAPIARGTDRSKPDAQATINDYQQRLQERLDALRP